jgi:anthranilate phosphoribosyltransferase
MDLKNFTKQNFEKLFDDIVEKKIPDDEIKKILVSLNYIEIPPESFAGAASSLKKRMKKISAPKNAIDVCGTGGDCLNTLNISTAVSFVVASSGVPVAKHGNKASSSLSGSADIFSELGIKIISDEKLLEKSLVENNLCFLFAPLFHNVLKGLSKIRQELKIPTIFNYLGPLLNPASTRKQLIGTSKRAVMKSMAISLQGDIEKTVYIVCGFDSMDEITLCDNSYLLKLEDGKILEEEIINPEKFGFKKTPLESLSGKDPAYNAQKLIALLDGEKSAYRDIVVHNSAFALK